MAWFDIKQNRLRYRDSISRQSFEEWSRTEEGLAAISAAAATLRIRLFAHTRARGRLWRDLVAAVRTESLRDAIQGETLHFASVVAELSYAPGLPRAQILLHRLVLVPRAMVASRARLGLRQRLWHAVPLASIPEPVRAFFCEQLLIEMDRAIDRSQPSPARPVAMRDQWSCVGTERDARWVDPIWSGPGWMGHLFLYEVPRNGLSRAQTRDVSRVIAELQEAFKSLGHGQREAIVRIAVDGLPKSAIR